MTQVTGAPCERHSAQPLRTFASRTSATRAHYEARERVLSGEREEPVPGHSLLVAQGAGVFGKDNPPGGVFVVAVTDEEGRFRAEGVPPGPFRARMIKRGAAYNLAAKEGLHLGIDP